MKKALTQLITVCCLVISLQSFSQDYDFVAKKFFSDYNETHTPFLKSTIENLGKQDLIYAIKEHINKGERLVEERDNKLESIQENFEDQYKKPEYHSDCKNYKSYNQKNESINKRANRACAYTKTTLNMYNMCKNNQYRTTNCSSQLNNHNRQVNLCNDLSYEQKQYYNKAVNYGERCNSYVNRFKRAAKNAESNYNTSHAKYARLIQNEEEILNINTTELISILNNALYPSKDYYPNGSLKSEGNIIFGTSKAIGRWKFYYENGQLKNTGSYTNGKQSDEWQNYHKNGNLAFLDNYIDGKQNGIGKSFHENGDLKTSGKYLNNKKTGEWKVYIDGKLSTANFVEGEQIGEWKYYDKNGNLIVEETLLEEKTRLAENGDATAQYNLGIMYSKGQETEKDLEKAFDWIQKSAKQGHTPAQYTLGRMYMLAQGVATNGDKAFYWAEIAAKKNDKDGQSLLGFLYFYGTSDKYFGNSSWSKAKIWLTKAKNQGATGVQKLLDEIGDE